MDRASPFKTSTFQELSNDISKFIIQWVLTPEISLWRFKSPLGLQLPKWEFTWECEGSFPHIFLHSREHEMRFLGLILARTLVSLCLSHEPKARITTVTLSHYLFNHYIISNKSYAYKAWRLFYFYGTFHWHPSMASWISNILVTHQILELNECFVEHHGFWCLLLPPTL
jgi:hypothetical protein